MPFLADPLSPWPSPGRKIIRSAQACDAFAALPARRVFTNGVFDIVHRGHVALLDQARSLGASLIVGVNSDASVRRLGKGPERPIHGEADRVFLLACLEAVDMVVLFDEDTPCALLDRLRPDLYVKGGDYDMATLAEARLVARWGGRALSLPFLHGHSTTSILHRLDTARTGALGERSASCATGVLA